MKKVTTDTPSTLKENLPETMSEQDAHKKAIQINNEDKDHNAKVENGKLKVNQVLKG